MHVSATTDASLKSSKSTAAALKTQHNEGAAKAKNATHRLPGTGNTTDAPLFFGNCNRLSSASCVRPPLSSNFARPMQAEPVTVATEYDAAAATMSAQTNASPTIHPAGCQRPPSHGNENRHWMVTAFFWTNFDEPFKYRHSRHADRA